VNDVFLSALARGIEQNQDAIYRLLDDNGASPESPPNLIQAARYSLEIGGKRIRPMLILFSARAVGVESTASGLDHLTCAIELIHTYSLIHDDLPAMDDDDLRRGKPSLHKAYDEATAILVGDGLQARAFELLADAPGLSAEQRIAMVKVLARAAGPAGMVGGQFIDIQATNSDMTLDDLKTMHSLKNRCLDPRVTCARGHRRRCQRATTVSAGRVWHPYWPRLPGGR
jgi:geranylgeranyl pyrophosphate synthase